jgi:O-antigen/teichoic acid export membrane protein
VILARSFAPAELGQFFFSISIIAAVTGLGLPGINSALISSVVKGEMGTFRRALAWKLSGGAIAGTAFLILSLLANERGVAPWANYVVALLLPLAFCDCGHTILIARHRFSLLSLVGFAQKIVTVAALSVIALSSLSIEWYFLASTAVQATSNLLVLRKQWASIGNSPECDTPALKYGIHLTLSNALLQPLTQLDKLLVGVFLGADQLAVFGLGEMVFGMLKRIGTHVQSLYPPRIAKLSFSSSETYLLRHCGLWLIAAFFSLAVFSGLFPILYPVIFGGTYGEAARIAVWYSFAFALGLPNNFVLVQLRHLQATRATYLYGLTKGPFQLLMILSGFSLLGPIGLPIGRGVSAGLHACYGAYLVHQSRRGRWESSEALIAEKNPLL